MIRNEIRQRGIVTLELVLSLAVALPLFTTMFVLIQEMVQLRTINSALYQATTRYTQGAGTDYLVADLKEYSSKYYVAKVEVLDDTRAIKVEHLAYSSLSVAGTMSERARSLFKRSAVRSFGSIVRGSTLYGPSEEAEILNIKYGRACMASLFSGEVCTEVVR